MLNLEFNNRNGTIPAGLPKTPKNVCQIVIGNRTRYECMNVCRCITAMYQFITGKTYTFGWVRDDSLCFNYARIIAENQNKLLYLYRYVREMAGIDMLSVCT